jgi:protein-S-isoprenylcysteine O-methyltransferase Ste14
VTAIALGALFGLGWIPLFAFRAETQREAMPFYSAAERFWVRAGPALVAVHVTLACTLVSFVDPLPPLRTALALALFFAALAFWYAARRQIAPLGQRRLPDDAPPVLRRDGPFGIVRNPLYLAYLAAGAAPAIVVAAPLLALTWLIAFAALAVRAAQEERRLHAQLGPAYAAYCREVKRLIPWLW